MGRVQLGGSKKKYIYSNILIDTISFIPLTAKLNII